MLVDDVTRQRQYRCSDFLPFRCVGCSADSPGREIVVSADERPSPSLLVVSKPLACLRVGHGALREVRFDNPQALGNNFNNKESLTADPGDARSSARPTRTRLVPPGTCRSAVGRGRQGPEPTAPCPDPWQVGGCPVRTGGIIPDVAVDRSGDPATRGNLYAVWIPLRNSQLASNRAMEGVE